MAKKNKVGDLERIIKRFDRYISGQRREIAELKRIADREEKMKTTMWAWMRDHEVRLKFDRNDIRQLKGR